MALTQVTSAGVKDGELVNADLHSAAAIALSKLGTSGTAGSGNFLRGDGAWTAIDLTALNASNLTSGTVAAARLDTATTQSAGNNSTKIATTAYADTAISNLVDSSPSALNTLNELAAALGDDANFSTTVTNSIATKAVLSGSTNNTICTVTGANAIQGETTLQWSGNALSTYRDNATTYGPGILGHHQRGTIASPSVSQTDDTILNIVAKGFDGTDYHDAARIDFVVGAGTPGNNDMPGSILFKTTDDGTGSSVTRLTIAQSGIIKLDDSATLLIPDAIQHTGDTNTQIRFPANDTFTVDTAGTERLRIQSTGVVNIGDSTASSLGDRLLQIGKTDRSATYAEFRTSTSGVGGIVFSDGTANNNTGYRGTIEYSHGNDALYFKTAATEKLRITDTGNVGISTTSPQRMLQVGAHGSGNGEIAIGSSTSGYGSILFGDGTSGNELYRGYVQYNHSGEYMLLATSGLERVRIGPSGEIGTGGASYGTSGQVLTSGGSGAAVSWTTISAGTTLSGSTDNEITTVTGANAIQGESNLLFSGNRFTVRSNEMVLGQTLPDGGIVVQAKTNMTDGYALPIVSASPNATQAGRARAGIAAISDSGVSGMHLAFMTRYAGDGTDLDVTADERLRITSDGKFGFNTTDTSGNQRVTIKQTGHDTPLFLLSDQSNCYMGLGNSVATNGYIGFESTALTFHANGKKMQVESTTTTGRSFLKSNHTGSSGHITDAFFVRCWMQMNGHGTISVTSHGYVSSVSDHGTGEYTMNIISNMADDNYAFLGCAMEDHAGISYRGEMVVNPNRAEGAVWTNGVRFSSCNSSSGNRTDCREIYVAIVR